MNVYGTLLYKVCMSIACTWLRAYQWCIENVWYVNPVGFVEVFFNIDWVPLVQYIQSVTIEFRQGSIYVVNSHFSRPPNRHKSSNSTKPFRPIFTISESFLMRYCVTLYLKGYKRYDRSKLKSLNLLNKSWTFNFDLSYFWYPLRKRVTQCLIGKLS